VAAETEKKVRRVDADWQNNRLFTVTNQEGSQIKLDVPKEKGGSGEGITPVEALQGAAAACAGIDLVNILTKMRQRLTSIRVTAETRQASEHPMYFTWLKLTFYVAGENIELEKVQKAVNLSMNKYCAVKASLSSRCEIETEIIIEK
jgi:putative redox protein